MTFRAILFGFVALFFVLLGCVAYFWWKSTDDPAARIGHRDVVWARDGLESDRRRYARRMYWCFGLAALVMVAIMAVIIIGPDPLASRG